MEPRYLADSLEDNSFDNELDAFDAKMNETFPEAGDPISLPADPTLNITTTNTFLPNGHSNNNTTFLENGIEIGSDEGASDASVWSSVISIGWIALWVYICCCQRNVPGREHWRGAQMRERYLRMQAQERVKEEREAQSPKYRHMLVEHNMRTKKVVAKDAQGNLTLGSIKETSSPAKSNPCPLEGDDIEAGGVVSLTEDFNEDDDHVCSICLDNFQVGDIVSWSRHSKTCTHVFHTDCVKPWLEDKRQNECPACRVPILLEDPPSLSDETSDESSSEDDSVKIRHTPDEEDDDRDSLFMIAHGMISRAARRASYTLIGNKDSIDEDLNNMSMTDLPIPPSPLRRVLSHGSVFRQRRPSLPSAPILGSTSSSSSAQSLLRNNSVSSNSGGIPPGALLFQRSSSSGSRAADRPYRDEYSLAATSSNEEDAAPSIPTSPRKRISLSSPFTFRKVKSDMGGYLFERTGMPEATIPETPEQLDSAIEGSFLSRPAEVGIDTQLLEQSDEESGEELSILEMMGYGRSGHLANEAFSDDDEEDDIIFASSTEEDEAADIEAQNA